MPPAWGLLDLGRPHPQRLGAGRCGAAVPLPPGTCRGTHRIDRPTTTFPFDSPPFFPTLYTIPRFLPAMKDTVENKQTPVELSFVNKRRDFPSLCPPAGCCRAEPSRSPSRFASKSMMIRYFFVAPHPPPAPLGPSPSHPHQWRVIFTGRTEQTCAAAEEGLPRCLQRVVAATMRGN